MKRLRHNRLTGRAVENKPTRAYRVWARVEILVNHAKTGNDAALCAMSLEALGEVGENVAVGSVRVTKVRRAPEFDGEASDDQWGLDED